MASNLTAFLNRTANRLVTAILRSPAHGVMSGKTMLITVYGRKTGRKYTTPVNYVREGKAITVFSREERSWWRNVRGRAPVHVLVRGRELAGTAFQEDLPPEALAETLQRFYLARGRRLSAEQASRRAQGRVMVRVLLDGG